VAGAVQKVRRDLAEKVPVKGRRRLIEQLSDFLERLLRDLGNLHSEVNRPLVPHGHVLEQKRLEGRGAAEGRERRQRD
jgi:hypothetical protein